MSANMTQIVRSIRVDVRTEAALLRDPDATQEAKDKVLCVPGATTHGGICVLDCSGDDPVPEPSLDGEWVM